MKENVIRRKIFTFLYHYFVFHFSLLIMDDHVQPTRTTKEDGMKKGKTFYKGRFKQVKRDRNPAQWTAYNRAPRVQHTITHYNPLASQLLKTRETGILSTKSLQNKNHENESEDETNMDQVLLHLFLLCNQIISKFRHI